MSPVPRSSDVRDPVLSDFLSEIEGVRPRLRRLTLFGSRARGEHRTDSDYDILVLVERKDPILLDTLYEGVMNVLLNHGRLVSLKVFEEKEFARLERLQAPFVRKVLEEGKPIG